MSSYQVVGFSTTAIRKLLSKTTFRNYFRTPEPISRHRSAILLLTEALAPSSTETGFFRSISETLSLAEVTLARVEAVPTLTLSDSPALTLSTFTISAEQPRYRRAAARG